MKIGVVGLGLIGGSIYKDLKNLGYEIIAVSKSQSGKDIFKDYDALKGCELVFVCSAMNKTMEVLDKLEDVLTTETIVTDVCSLKRFVCAKKRPYNFIPSHPMAGTEHSGFENSLEGLFKGAKWVVTPLTSKDNQGVEKLTSLIKELGAEPVFATPEEHDRAAALISHMPMVVAQALYKAASGNELALKIASSGFRDMTRLALSNTEMANDMVTMNSDNIEQSILKLYKAIGDLTCGDYLSEVEDIKSNRRLLFM